MPSIEQLEKLLAVDPDDSFVHYALALEYAKGGAHDKAADSFDRCIAIDEHYCYAYFHKAKSLEADNKLDDARSTLETGLGIAKQVGDQKAASEIGSYLSILRVTK